MAFVLLSLPAVILVLATSLINLITRDQRVVLIAMGFQYIGVFILVALTWPPQMALIKLITGLVATGVIAMELVIIPGDQSFSPDLNGEPLVFSNVLFRIFLSIVIGMTIYSLTPELAKWILNASYHQILGSLLLIGMGILILGTTSRPFRVVVGLLTFLSGFEVLFATLETSSIVVGFFALTSLGISLLGSYFMASPKIKEEV